MKKQRYQLIKRLSALLLVVLLMVINIWNAFHTHREGRVKTSTTSCIVKDDCFNRPTNCILCKYKFFQDADHATLVIAISKPAVSTSLVTAPVPCFQTADPSIAITRGPPVA